MKTSEFSSPKKQMFSNYVIKNITEIIHFGLQIANVLNL